MVWLWNFHIMFYDVLTYLKPNFNSTAHLDGKLWIVKVWKLDVCGRPLFANPVTICDNTAALLCKGYC